MTLAINVQSEVDLLTMFDSALTAGATTIEPQTTIATVYPSTALAANAGALSRRGIRARSTRAENATATIARCAWWMWSFRRAAGSTLRSGRALSVAFGTGSAADAAQEAFIAADRRCLVVAGQRESVGVRTFDGGRRSAARTSAAAAVAAVVTGGDERRSPTAIPPNAHSTDAA